jgi:hypothetical protein
MENIYEVYSQDYHLSALILIQFWPSAAQLQPILFIYVPNKYANKV